MTTDEMPARTETRSTATGWSLLDGRYPSLAALRTAHLDLLTRYESNREKPSEQFLDEVEVFLERGERTGCAIESQTDRRAAQVLLDYWNALLFRCGRNRPIAILGEYDASLERRVTFDEADCPYPGPVPFSDGQANRFFGREALISDAVRLLETARIVAVLGPAASGKTSLVRAGILPALSSGAIDNSRAWEYLVLTLGANPLEQLVRTCFPKADDARLAETMGHLRGDPSALALLLAERQPVLLFVDQLEELYDTTDADMAPDRETVLRQLEHIATASNLEVRMIVAACVEDTMTAESYSAALVPPQSRVDLPRMGTRELTDAIVQPADQIGLKFEEGVVPDLVRTLIGVPAVLPLLQFVMLQLWDRRDHNRITREAFNSVLWDPQRRRPNVVMPITRAADGVYTALSPEDRVLADAILLQLVEPGLGWDFELMSPRLSDVHVSGASRADVERVLSAFEAARLVRRNKIDAEASPRVRLIHESLPRYWQPLIELLDARRHDQRQKLRLGDTARLWRERDRDPTLLWSGVLLQEAGAYANLTPEEREFLDESDRVEHLASRRRARNLALAIICLFVVAVGSFLSAVLLFRLNAISTAAQLAVVAQNQVASNPDRAMLLAERAYSLDKNPATRQGLLFVVDHNVQLVEHLSDGATASAVSPTGDLVAIGHLDGKIDLWRGMHEVEETKDAGPAVVALAFAPDGNALLSVGRGGQLAYWDPRTLQAISPPLALPPRLPPALESTNPNISALVISTRGDVAVAGTDKDAAAVKAFLWDARQQTWRPDPIATVSRSRNAAALTFSPDGGQLLLGSGDCSTAANAPCSGSLQLVSLGATDPAAATTPQFLSMTIGPVHTVAFGRRIVAFGDGPSVVLWDLQRDQEIAQLAPNVGSTHPVESIALNPDESMLAVGGCQQWNDLGGDCLQGQILFYSTDDGTPVGRSIPAHLGLVRQVAFMSAGKRLISMGPDSVLAWDLTRTTTTPQAWPTIADVNAVQGAESLALQSDTGVLALGFQNLVDVWRSLPDGSFEPVQTLKTTSGVVRAVALGPGGTLAASGPDGAILLWNTHDWSTRSPFPRLDAIPANQPYSVTSLGVADDNASVLVAGGALGDVALWDLATGTPTLLRPPQLQDPQMTNAVAVSRDGRWVAAGGCDAAGESSQQVSRCQLGRINLWDVRKSNTPVSLSGHAGAVQQLAFNTDGSLLASTGYDGSVIVWNPETAQPIQQYAGLVGAKALVFQRDDSLNVYDQDSRIQLALVGVNAMESRACAIAHRTQLTDPEWDAAIPSSNPFQPLLENLQGLRNTVCQSPTTRG